MMLLVDIGNTCLHWACADADALRARGAIVHHDAVPENVVAAWLAGDKPARVLIASVAGEQLTNAVRQWVAEHWHIRAEMIVATEQFGDLINGYAEFGRLGVDRWLAMIAAQRHYGRPVCVIDCGTALTADVVSAEGRHLGGLIMPGLSMMRRSLSEHTMAITDYDPDAEQPEGWLADNSRDAVLTGTRYMLLAVINEFVRDAAKRLGSEPTCVITGGAADSVRPRLGEHWYHDPDLVFHGMRIVAGSLS